MQFREVTTPDGQLVRPPSRALLELHAACAKIAHLSGAGELLDDIYQEEGPMNGVPLSLPDMTVYAPAADYLQRALTRAGRTPRMINVCRTLSATYSDSYSMCVVYATFV